MSTIRVCDLCGLPLPLDDGEKEYIIRERKQGWWKAEWITIDAHDSCVKQLLKLQTGKRRRQVNNAVECTM